MKHMYQRQNRAMSLVEVIVAVAVLLLVFGGLMSAFQVIATLVGSSKAQAGALALANEKMEYIRSLEYNNVGTVSGIPNGLIPQTSTTTLNGIVYDERVLIEYFDAPQDGQGALDENGIVADYKRVKVEYSWDDKGSLKVISLISNIVPRGIETTAGGGTLTINVFDADVLPLSGASVRVFNDTGTTTIDITRSTNANGVAMISGAPALSNYEITVTDTGFSTDQTYAASTSNPNPITSHVSVLESQVSTMNFQIDELSDLTVVTVAIPTLNSFEDLFNDDSTVATSTGVTVASGSVTLSGASGSYGSSGMLLSDTVTPVIVDAWNSFSYGGYIPTNTTLVVHVYDLTGTSTPRLILDSDLSGNAVGFAPGTIDISALDVSTYEDLALGASFGSSDVATSSILLDWELSYTESQSPIASVPFRLTSTKTIGTTATAVPVYKYQRTFTTNGSGNATVSDLEWGTYTVEVTDTSYDIAEACNNIPYQLDPGVSDTLTLTLAPASAHSLRVSVINEDGDTVPNANVELSRSGYNASDDTSLCGQVFFNSGLSSATDYEIEVSAFGYVTQTVTAVEVTGESAYAVTLVEI